MGTISWRQLLGEAGHRLGGPGSPSLSPAVDARRIVEEASGWEGSELQRRLDAPATERGVARFDHMLGRRLAGEPLQYVLGRWGFRTLDLAVDSRALIPRPETERVVEEALRELDRSGKRTARVVDLGTGSGAIALSVAAEREGVEVWATDVSTDALALARANLAGLAGRSATRVRLAEGDWFAALPPALAGTVDLVVANPPYVAAGEPLPAEVADWEPTRALVAGPTGLEAIAVIVTESPRWLAAGGAVVVEIGDTQAAAAAGLARAAGLSAVEVRPDLARRPRILVAHR